MMSKSRSQVLLVTVRWHWISGFLGGALSFWRTLGIVEIGFFFNQALPATVGGDGARIFYAWKSGMPAERAFHSVICDRLAGMAGLILAGLVGMPFLPGPQGRVSAMMLFAVVAGAVVAVIVFVLRRYWIAWLPTAMGAQLRRFIDLGRQFAVRPTAWFWMLIPSISIQLLSTLFIYAALDQFGIKANFLDCAVLVAAVSLVIAIPISVAGWGVREGALVVALATIGVPAGDAVASSLLAGVAQLIVALPGGLLLLVFKSKDRGPEG